MFAVSSLVNRALASILRFVASTSIRGTNWYLSNALLFAKSVEHVPALPKVYMYAAAQEAPSVAAMRPGHRH